mgnify:CR=1 FL=1
MHFELTQLVAPVSAIVLLVLLITKLRLHPFPSLMIAAGFLGLVTGLAPADMVKTFQKGVGSILGSTGLVVGLGSMLGGLLLDSGGADRIANTFVGAGSKRWIPASICAAALLIGLPHLFDVSFVMLVPLVYAIAQRTGSRLMLVGLPMAAGLYISHGLLPPHPSPTLALSVFHGDAGRTIFFGLLVAIPTAILSGPVFTSVMGRWLPESPDLSKSAFLAQRRETADGARPVPPLPLVLLAVLMPPGLMMLRTFGRNLLAKGDVLYQVLELVGDPVVSLLIAVLFALWALGLRTGRTPAQLQKLLGKSLAPAAGVILIIGAGGGLKEMLLASHIGEMIAHWAALWQINPLLLAWSVAALIRIAVGSATVATVTAAGIVAPIALNSGVSPELLVLATSSGSVMMSHLNDSGFWLFKEYFQLSVGETFRTWTLMLCLQSLLGLIGVLLIQAVIG